MPNSPSDFSAMDTITIVVCNNELQELHDVKGCSRIITQSGQLAIIPLKVRMGYLNKCPRSLNWNWRPISSTWQTEWGNITFGLICPTTVHLQYRYHGEHYLNGTLMFAKWWNPLINEILTDKTSRSMKYNGNFTSLKFTKYKQICMSYFT
jgi:hypothetical protein